MSDCCTPRPEPESGEGTVTAGPQCPECGRRGRPVSEVTLRALARPEALARAGKPEGFRFCATPSCPVVWYRAADGLRFTEHDALVRVGIKEGPAPHPLCYCFEHTREEIEEEVRRTGDSRVPDEVARLCKQGLDRCEETNPRGACCLGDLREAVRRAREAAAAEGGPTGDGSAVSRAAAASGTSAFASGAPAPAAEAGTRGETDRRGWWALLASVGAAVLASACCWLPLVAVLFGATATGAGAFFERWRPWLLAVAGVTLGLSFWLLFLRPARAACCAEDGACAIAGRKPRLFSILLFSLAVLGWGAAAFFPSYVGTLLGGERPAADTVPPASARRVVFELGGLSCEGCAAIVEDAAREVPGVVGVEVDYPSRRASVLLEGGADAPAVARAIEEAGYEARPIDEEPPGGEQGP